MKISAIIEKNFWIFLIAGLVAGIWQPVKVDAPGWVPKILLEMMLLLVFLKTDFLKIFDNLRDIKLMSVITITYMVLIPLALYFIILPFSHDTAIAVLLLTAMPAGASSPALTDIARGNTSLAMSVALVTQLAAPFTIPLLFIAVNIEGVEINKLLLLKDVALLILIPMAVSLVIRTFFTATVEKVKNYFTSVNVLVLFAFVYIAISSQRDVILSNPASLIWKVIFLYMLFVFLHLAGYFICFRRPKEDRIALSITSAYMNNGLAIVLAAAYFAPPVLVLMVLSEIPWNTLLAPFKRLTSHS